jgi:mono/diheme cytochrome c family protein
MSILHLRAKRTVLIPSLAVALVAVSLVVGVMIGPFGTRETASPEAEAFAVRGAAKLKAAYGEWVAQHNAQGGDKYVAISLGYWKALSASYTTANGVAKLNLIDGTVSVTVSGLPTGDWDVWLVDNRPGPGRSIKPEPSDAMIRAGRLMRNGDVAKLDAELGAAAFNEFHVDLVVVAPAGADPGSGGLLFGAPSLFQSLYTALRSPKLLMASDFAAQPGIRMERRWASVLGTPTAEADDIGIFVNEDVVNLDLVRRGADLFLNEKFNGNGRTCASCHRKERNFTIDVNFIAELPNDDALFVAEFTPALAFSPFGPKFEVPVLMRKHALITENVDGMTDLVNRFALRGVPHTLGLRQSLTDANIVAGQPQQRTGWSGDGAPGNGTLKDFATGAVTQHFTKRLNRVPGVDFRLPTENELLAMEAFQLTLGRQAELNITTMSFKNAVVARGRDLFILGAGDGGGGCQSCHANGGANDGNGNNRNRDTGVEDQPDRPAELTLRALNIDLTPGIPQNIMPRDGGFGQTPIEGLPDGPRFGDRRFNTVSLVEAADTGPFFHDNSIETIEGAVAFYNSRSFNNAGDGRGIAIEATQVEAIAAFLRVLNALDNIRESSENATAAKRAGDRAGVQLLNQSIFDAEDAINVLFARSLHPSAVKSLERAIDHLKRAGNSRGVDRGEVDRALADLARARADIVR